MALSGVAFDLGSTLDNDRLGPQKKEVLEKRKLQTVFHVGTSAFTLLPEMLQTARVMAMNTRELYFHDPAAGDNEHALGFVSITNERRMLRDLKLSVNKKMKEAGVTPGQLDALLKFKAELVALCNELTSPSNVPCKQNVPVGSSAELEKKGTFAEMLKSCQRQPMADVSIVDFEGMGWGVVANQDLKEGDAAFKIPAEYLINKHTARTLWGEACLAIEELMKEQMQDDDEDDADDESKDSDDTSAVDDTVTTLFSIHEKHNPKSRWRHYFDHLIPPLYNVLTMDPADVEQLLDGTPLVREASQAREHLDNVYKSLFPTLSKRNPELFPPEIFTPEEFAWARVLFDTRGMSCEIGGKDVTCLVPLADMMNHSPTAQVSFRRYDENEKCLVFPCFSDIKAGSQVSMFYGTMAKWEMLLHYGFIDDDYSGETVRVDFEPPIDDLVMRKILLLNHLDLRLEHFLRATGPVSHRLLGAVRLCLSTEDELRQNFERIEYEFVTPRCEYDVFNTLRSTCQCLLADFPETIQEDEELLQKEPTPTEEVGHIKRAIIEYRLHQKRILQHNIGIVDGMEAELQKVHPKPPSEEEEEEHMEGDGVEEGGEQDLDENRPDSEKLVDLSDDPQGPESPKRARLESDSDSSDSSS